MDRSKACRVIDSLPPLHIRVIGLESRLWPDADAFSNQMQYDDAAIQLFHKTRDESSSGTQTLQREFLVITLKI